MAFFRSNSALCRAFETYGDRMDETHLLDPTLTRDLDTIPGWFNPSDRRLFDWILTRQSNADFRGNLVELGAYLGKSAVLIGRYVQPGEIFTVLDMFESEASDAENAGEVARSYASLTEQAFRENYLRFHEELPVVVRATSDHIGEHVEPGSARFFHIDASHNYIHVAGDADSAKRLLAPEGIVVFDDFRAEHTPGVAAAAWEAVTNKGLNLIAVSESKLYGTWGDPQPWRAALADWLTSDPQGWCEWHTIHGQPIVRCKVKMPPEPEPEPVVEPEPEPQPTPRPGRSLPRQLAKDWLPPAVHRAVSHRLNPPA